MPKKSNQVPLYHIYQFGKYKGTLFGTKRDRSPEKIQRETYYIFESDFDDEEQQEQRILEQANHGDIVEYRSNNQEGSAKTNIIRNRDGTLRLGKWKYLMN